MISASGGALLPESARRRAAGGSLDMLGWGRLGVNGYASHSAFRIARGAGGYVRLEFSVDGDSVYAVYFGQDAAGGLSRGLMPQVN